MINKNTDDSDIRKCSKDAACKMRSYAEENGLSDMTLEDVNDIISKTRIERKTGTDK